MADRRDFLKLTAAAAVGVAALGALPVRAEPWTKPAGVPRAGKKLKILILGGTRFLGPHEVEYALARGHEVTLFNRGKSRKDPVPGVENLRGDRNDDLKALEGRSWDVVIDNSAHVPRWVRTASEVLEGNVGRYLFISSTGVYFPYEVANKNEDTPVSDDVEPNMEEVTDSSFGPLKVLCEREAEKWFPGRTTVVRPHLIVGPGDNSDRFTYWPRRIARGGEVLCPGNPDDPVQIIDVRDLARFIILCLEEGKSGIFNGAGPYSGLTIGGLVHGARACFSNEISFTWADREFLAEHGIGGWTDLTVWLPPVGELEHMCRIDGSKAVREGMTFRPLAETVRDTYQWWLQLPQEKRDKPRCGLAAQKEAEVLAAWHARQG